MVSADKILQIAAAELGYSRWDDPLEGTKYGRHYAQKTGSPYFGLNGVPYCCMGVSWAFDMGGGSILGNGKRYAYVPYMENDARALGRLRSWEEIAPGDVLNFDWDNDGVSDHTGFAVRREGDYIHTIEFNTSGSWNGSQSNGGGVYRRVRHRSTVSAVIRPAYDNAPAKPARKFLDITGVQKTLGCDPDNVSGPITRSHLQAIKDTSTRYWGNLDTEGIKHAQRVVGTDPDGIWGDNSRACHDRAVENLQRALCNRGYYIAVDGIYGPDTDAAAWDALSKAEQA